MSYCFALYFNQWQVDGHTVADFKHIRQMYSLEKAQDVRRVPKLRDWHINLTLAQRMKVKYAAQVLSRSVSAGINL